MQHIGTSSISFKRPVYISQYSSIVGQKEGQGPLSSYFDEIYPDPLFSGKNWEEAESLMINKNIQKLLDKAELVPSDIHYLLSGDLLGQLIATSFGVTNYNIPLFGLYGACSTFGEALSLGSILIAGGFAKNVISSASSHFASAEKTFRFPLDYGSQRKESSTWTVTGCGSVILSSESGKAKISGITTGKIVDYGVKDKENMGACMAPAAADTILNNFKDFGRNASDYDKIITGDLGLIGQKILFELLKEKGYDISKNHMDCGIEIYNIKKQDVGSGGSGCGCSATTFCGYIMNMLETKQLKRILFVPTGALLSPTSSNEGNTVPGIAHGIVVETLNE